MTEQLEHAIVTAYAALAVIIGATTSTVALLVAVGAWTSTPTTQLCGWILNVLAAVCAAAWWHLRRWYP